MYIIFKDSKFQQLCHDGRKLIKKYGYNNSSKIVQRLNELMAVNSLGIMLQFKIGRCHPLTENLKGKFALDLEHPKRLIFEPIFEEEVDLSNINYCIVKKVRVLGVIDYHGK